MTQIPISPFLAKIILRFNPFDRLKVMCLGYGEDFEQFTELVWEDDKDLDFTDQESYPKFELWYI
jgi:hypothetical protein